MEATQTKEVKMDKGQKVFSEKYGFGVVIETPFNEGTWAYVLFESGQKITFSPQGKLDLLKPLGKEVFLNKGATWKGGSK